MTTKDVCQALRSELKAYIGKMQHSTYFSTLSRIEKGSAKPSTISSFFEKFGYSGSYNEWKKGEPVADLRQ